MVKLNDADAVYLGSTLVDAVMLGDTEVWTGTFDPASLGNLYAWYDASDTATITASSGDVSQWADKSGNGRHLIGAGTQKPKTGTRSVLGLNVLDFAHGGGVHVLNAPDFELAQPLTFYIVTYADSYPSNVNRYLDGYDNVNGSRVIIFREQIMGDWNLGNSARPGHRPGEGSSMVHSIIFNKPNTKFYEDGVQYGGNLDSDGGPIRDLNIGAGGIWAPGEGDKWDGWIGEVLIYSGAHNDASREQVEAYLLGKWKPSIRPYGVAIPAVGWWAADDLELADNDAVASWADASGYGYDMAQGTAANRPLYKTGIINGLPVVRFDGTNDALATTEPVHSDFDEWTMVLVSKPISPGTERSPFHNGSGLNGTGFADNTGGTGKRGAIWGGVAWHASSSDTAAAAAVQVMRRDGGTVKLYVNGGASVLTTTSGPAKPTGSTKMGSHSGSDAYWNGDIAEALCFPRPLSDADVNLIGDALADKYGLSWSAIS